jgi:hypothetical protein
MAPKRMDNRPFSPECTYIQASFGIVPCMYDKKTAQFSEPQSMSDVAKVRVGTQLPSFIAHNVKQFRSRIRHVWFTQPPVYMYTSSPLVAVLKYKHYAIEQLYHHITSLPGSSPRFSSQVCITKENRAMRSEGVVLGRDLVVVEAANEGDLLENVGLHARNAVEEEDGEDAGGGSEGGADGAPDTKLEVRSFEGVEMGSVFLLAGDVHSEESAGGEAAELGFGDGVAAERGWLVSCAGGAFRCFDGHVPRAVLALEGLVGYAAAHWVDAGGGLDFEAVHGLCFLSARSSCG